METFEATLEAFPLQTIDLLHQLLLILGQFILFIYSIQLLFILLLWTIVQEGKFVFMEATFIEIIILSPSRCLIPFTLPISGVQQAPLSHLLPGSTLQQTVFLHVWLVPAKRFFQFVKFLLFACLFSFDNGSFEGFNLTF